MKRELRERDKEVEKDVMDWTRVTRDKRQGKRTIQIFVKVDGSRAITMEMALSDKVSDVAQRSVCCNESDVYVTSGGLMLRRNEEMRSCGVSAGSTVEVTSRMRGGGKEQNREEVVCELKSRT